MKRHTARTLPCLEQLEARTFLSTAVGAVPALPTISVSGKGAASETSPLTRGAATFTLSRTGPLTDPLTVTFSLTGTATSGTDYISIPTSVTFAAGQSRTRITVNPIDDSLAEPTESVVLTLDPSASYNLRTRRDTATINIRDNEPIIGVTARGAISEASTRGISFVLTRSGGDRSVPFTVNFSLTGTATNGTDYLTLPGSVTFAAGQTRALVTVKPIDDTLAEGPETVTLTLTPNASFTIQNNRAAANITITDNEPVVSIQTLRDASEANLSTSGLGLIRLTRSGPRTDPLTVNLNLTGTAVAGTDFETFPTSVTFAPGQSTLLLTVNPLLNTATDANTTLIITPVASPDFSVSTLPGRDSATVVINNVTPADFLDITRINTPGLVGTYQTTSTSLGASQFAVTALSTDATRLTMSFTTPDRFTGVVSTRTFSFDFLDTVDGQFLISRSANFGAIATTLSSPLLQIAPPVLDPGTFTDSAPTVLDLGSAGLLTGTTTVTTTLSGAVPVKVPAGTFNAVRIDISLRTDLQGNFVSGGISQPATYTSSQKLTLYSVPGIGIVRAQLSTQETAFPPAFNTPITPATTFVANLATLTLGGTVTSTPTTTPTTVVSGTGIVVGNNVGSTTVITGTGSTASGGVTVLGPTLSAISPTLTPVTTPTNTPVTLAPSSFVNPVLVTANPTSNTGLSTVISPLTM